jgi:DNA invertase Pin-like site-specific DNA recombinase
MAAGGQCDQTLDLQRDALKRAKCREIYEEHASGKTALRPELDACLKPLRKGDTLVVWRLDRLAAAAKGGIYGNDAVEAMYPMTKTLTDGEVLDGSKHNYTTTVSSEIICEYEAVVVN